MAHPCDATANAVEASNTEADRVANEVLLTDSHSRNKDVPTDTASNAAATDLNTVDADASIPNDNNSTSANSTNAPPPPAHNHCGFCGEPATLHCAGCNNIKYCNRDCQKKDWRMHKHLCKTFDNFTTSPGQGYRRVIVLPRDSNIPHFAWMETWVSDGDEDEEEDSDVDIDDESGVPEWDTEPGQELGYPEALFGDSSFQSYNEIVVGKIGHGQHLDHSIAVYHEVQPSVVNQCLNFLTRGKSSKELRFAGKGLIVLYCMSKSMQPKFVRDANCSDLTLGVKGWFDYNKQYGERQW